MCVYVCMCVCTHILVINILFYNISGSLSFDSCRVVEVSDFYPIFFNPTQDYVHQLHCSYEVVYPLLVTHSDHNFTLYVA